MTIAINDAPSADSGRRKRIFYSFSVFFSLLNRSLAAARAFESLSNMTDAELAGRGLNRADIPLVAKRVLLDED